MSWITCKVDNDYEIFTEFPYQIRRKSNKRIIKEWVNNNGYLHCSLNKKDCHKHVIIAKQFIPNDDPENKTIIDHIDRNKLNNNISNLRWCSVSDNSKNKVSYNGYEYKYVDNIDDDCIIVDTYNHHKLENYYFDSNTDTFYFYNGIKYRKLKINYRKNNYPYVNMRDINNKNINVLYSKFKKQYDLI